MTGFGVRKFVLSDQRFHLDKFDGTETAQLQTLLPNLHSEKTQQPPRLGCDPELDAILLLFWWGRLALAASHARYAARLRIALNSCLDVVLATARRGSLFTWAYTSVVRDCACPKTFPTKNRGAPAATAVLAHVCRRS